MKTIKKALLFASILALSSCDFSSILNMVKPSSETTQNTDENKQQNNQNNNQENNKTNLIDWPTQTIAENLHNFVSSETTAVIPAMVSEVEGTKVTVNPVPEIYAFAINIDGLGKESVEAYKNIVESAGWTITEGNQPGEYFAFWIDEKVKLDIYYEDQYGRLNIDVFAYSPTIAGWPYDQVAALVETMGLTGEVIPFAFANSGFRVDEYGYPPGIIINVEKGKEEFLAEQYNQSLVKAGLKVMGQLYGEDSYGKDGETLTYRAAALSEKTVTIELIDINLLS